MLSFAEASVEEHVQHGDKMGNDLESDREKGNAPTTVASVGVAATRCTQDLASEIDPKDVGDLSPFFFVTHEVGHGEDHLVRHDGDIDIPRPRTHCEVARYLAAKSAVERRLAAMLSSKVSAKTEDMFLFREGTAC